MATILKKENNSIALEEIWDGMGEGAGWGARVITIAAKQQATRALRGKTTTTERPRITTLSS